MDLVPNLEFIRSNIKIITQAFSMLRLLYTKSVVRLLNTAFVVCLIGMGGSNWHCIGQSRI